MDQPDQPQPATFLLTQAASMLGLSPVTLRKRAAAGLIPGYKPGRSWVFLQDELLVYLKSTQPPLAKMARTSPVTLSAASLRAVSSDPPSVARAGSLLAQRIARQRNEARRLKPKR